VTRQDKVAVIGCGGVGLGAIAAIAFRGASAIAIDIDDGKLAIARKAGATYTINSASESLHQKLLEITDDGPDVVIEAVGTPATYQAAVVEVAPAGRVVYIGYAKEPVAYETKLFLLKELDIMGSRNSLGEFSDIIAMLEKGTFPVDEMITGAVCLADAGETLRAWSENPQAFTKIHVELND
jgi:threonine dehydrogenase-like Zn-dependent dehydrogenase